MKKQDQIIRVGIGGYGRSGCDIHSNWFKQDRERFHVVAVADALPERRRDAVKEWGCAVYNDYRELLKKTDMDLFVNALPSLWHSKGSCEAFKTGRHVVCEKPSGRTVAEFDRMVAASREAGRKLLPFQNSRFCAYFRKMREVIDSGILGEILHIRTIWGGFGRRWDWQTFQSYGGGNLLNTGPHPMDHAVVLLNARKPRVCCQMRSIQPFGGDAEDYCNVTLYGKNLPTVEILLSSYLAYPMGDQYNVQGTLGGLAGNASRLNWRYFDPSKASDHALWKPWSDRRRYCSETIPWIEEKWEPAEEPATQSKGFSSITGSFYDNAYNVLTRNAASEIKLKEVRRQIEIIEECHRQNKLPKRVAPPRLP